MAMSELARRRRREIWLGRASWSGVVVALVIIASLLHPLGFPGPATAVIIKGSSMLPTYKSGDLVIVKSQNSYQVGDAVAYKVPQGQLGAGDTVIHRIIGGNGRDGFNLQGDNNKSADPWHPTTGDIVGKQWLYLPV